MPAVMCKQRVNNELSDTDNNIALNHNRRQSTMPAVVWAVIVRDPYQYQ